MERVDPVGVVVNDFSLSLLEKSIFSNKTREVKLLRAISADIHGGQLVAIMGGSGSGKTTFINSMAGRMHGKNIQMHGSIAFTERQVSVGYVLQTDFLLPLLTVRETLQYAAALRLPASMSRKSKHQRVEEVILELGLKDCASTKIGNEMVRGVSGGEKRRVSIACQMLTNPNVLFLDEPTTGLDSFTAHNIVETLSNIAKQGRTVICSIHQPRSDIFHLLDSIMLLSKGRLVYWGRSADVFGYFSTFGYECPANVNPADFFLDIVSVDYTTPEAEEESKSRVEDLLKSYETALSKTESITPSLEKQYPVDAKVRVPPTPAMVQISVLIQRAFLCIVRDRFLLFGGFMEAALLGLLLGGIFYKNGDDQSLSGLKTRLSLLYTVIAIQFYAILVYYIYKLVKELRVFDFEYDDGMYGALPYVLSQFVSNLPVDLVNGFVYALVTYNMISLRSSDHGAHFGIYAFVMMGVHFMSISFAWMCASLHREYAIASLIGNFLTALFGLTSGFLLNLHTIPVYVGWIKHVSFINYAYQMLAINEFRDAVYLCPAPGTPVCPLFTGNSILKDIDAETSYAKPAVIFVAILLFFRLASAVALKYIMFRPTAMSGATTTTNKSAKSARRLRRRLHHSRVSSEDLKLDVSVTVLDRPQVSVSLRGINLSVKSRRMFRRTNEYVRILNNITDIEIRPGRLFAIMGGSGSGKTSLLNLIGGRVVNVKMEGQILFNGQEPSLKVLKSIVGYVTQNDYLLPALTVRETLTYAALLRLPPSMSSNEKYKRVDDVIQELGLKDCANTRIGDELVRGVSGGEKRRVSIGIQLLTDPSILLLDEPTSGLDSFTANKLVESLAKIAQRNRTVIMSIHQPRSDIYALMDDVFILTKGNIAFCGPREDTLTYFRSLSFECPPHTNPADFYLDITSVDLRSPQAEEESRARVKLIVDSFEKLRGFLGGPSNPRDDVSPLSSPSPADRILSRDRERAMAPFLLSVPLLTSRGFVNIIRTPAMTSARLTQVAGFGLILLLFFCRLGNDYYSVQNRIGLLYEMVSPLLFTGMLNCIAVFPTERNVFYREKSDGAYSSSAFLTSYMINEVPFELITVLIYTILLLPAIGLQSSPDRFFSAFFVNWCLVFSGESFGIIFCGIFYSVGFSVSVTSVFLSAFCAMTGFIAINMPSVFKVVNHISILMYACEFVAINEFTGIHFKCTAAQLLADGTCPFTTGEQVLATYQFSVANKWESFGLVIVLTVVYRLICFIIFKFVKRQYAQ